MEDVDEEEVVDETGRSLKDNDDEEEEEETLESGKRFRIGEDEVGTVVVVAERSMSGITEVDEMESGSVRDFRKVSKTLGQ